MAWAPVDAVVPPVPPLARGEIDVASVALVEDRCDEEEGTEEVLEIGPPGERVLGMVEEERAKDGEARRRGLARARFQVG